MKFTALCLAGFAALASSTAIDVNKRASALEVTLEGVGNSKVKASVTNTASQGYNLFYKGTFLDSTAPVDKFVVSSSSARAAFNGVVLRVATSDAVLTAENFVAIEAGQTLTTEVDVAELYDVETTDAYTIQAMGAMPYAELNSTTLSGSAIPFASNQLTMSIDGEQAKTVAYAIARTSELEKRTRVASCSSSSHLSTLRTALSNCATLASAAASAASSGSSSRFQEYFKTTSSSVRSTVAARFRAVASDCSSTSGSTTTYCSDVYGYCTSGVLAYTIPSTNEIAYCNLFYTALGGVSGTCHAQDQATTVIHEETHAPAVYSPGTDDLGYGYSAATSLSSSQAVLNADSYALFANAVYVGC